MSNINSIGPIKKSEMIKNLDLLKPGMKESLCEYSGDVLFTKGLIASYNEKTLVTLPFPTSKNKIQILEGSVPFKQFYELIKKYPGEELTLIIGENEIKIDKGSNIKSGISLKKNLEDLDLSEMRKSLEKTPFQEVTPIFLEALKFCEASASSDSSSGVFTFIHLKEDTMESCDIWSSSRVSLDKSYLEILISKDKVKDILVFSPDKLYISKNWYHFSKGEVVLSLQNPLGLSYPNLDSIFEDSSSVEINFPEKSLSILDRVSIFPYEDLQQNRLLMITLKKGEILFRGENDIGWLEESELMEIPYKGEEISFRINPDNLGYILKSNLSAQIFSEKVKFSVGKCTYISSIKK